MKKVAATIRWISLGLCLFFFQPALFAQVMPTPVVTANPCTRTFNLKFPIWRQQNGGEDNELGFIDIYVNDGGPDVKIFRGDFWEPAENLPVPSWVGGPWPWTTAEFEPWDDDQYFTEQFLNGWSATKVGGSTIPGLVAGSFGNTSWVTYELRFASVPASWYGKTISVKLFGDYDENQATIDQTVTMSFPAIPSPSGLQTSGNCSAINVSWTKPNLPCSDAQHSYQIRYRLPGGAFGNWLPVPGDGNTTTFSHTGLNPGDQYEYEVRTVLLNAVFSNASDRVTGTAAALPAAPNSFMASTTNCNSTVNLIWGFTNGINQYVLYRNGMEIATIAGNIINYTDMVPARGVNYSYTITGRNECGTSPAAGPINGISPSDPAKPADVNAEVLPGVGVLITWPDVNGENFYKIERNLLGGGGASFFEVGANITSYLDQSLIPCQTYEYRVSAVNDCRPFGVVSDSVARVRLVPDLSNAFNPNTSLIASKGFFSNRVELSWSHQVGSNLINAYKIYRKQLGSLEDSTVVGTLNSGSNLFVDTYIEAGVLYEYFIVAESQCENTTIYSNVARSIGFRSPFGIVTGKVSYSGGIAVEGVRISAESTAGIYGKSVSLNGAGTLRIKDAASLDVTGGLLLEAWIRPASYAGDFTLIEKAGSYSLKYIHAAGQYRFTVHKSPTEMATLTIPRTEVMVNNFSHIAAQIVNDSLQFFVNGTFKAGQSALAVFTGGVDIHDNDSDVLIGAGFQGIMDELRIWNIGKTAAQMRNDFSRVMNGGEVGLKVYLRMDEGVGSNAYDVSRSGTLYNRNHAAFEGMMQWSDVIPGPSQLGASAYTDHLGNYVLNVPYHGNGEVFVLTPSYLTHVFDPSTAALYLGDGSSVHIGVNFIDRSSFRVTGSLNFKNTTCGVKGATLKVDGELVVVDGLPVKTDDAGLFEIQVPIGLHSIEVEQDGHVYSVGRFPATGKYNFQEDLAGVNFIDSTLVKVVGRVVGGLREARKIPGLGKSKNNIGQAKISLISQQGNGCFAQSVLTDPTTGEYMIMVPPLKYVPSVSISSNPAIQFGVLDLVDLSGTPMLQTKYDTTFNAGGNVVRIDSIKFHKQLDYIYRVNPKIDVFDRDGVSPFIGDSIYTFVNVETGDTLMQNLRTEPFRWPILRQQDDDFLYRALIRVFELYANLDSGSPVSDSVPTIDGVLRFNNELSHLPNLEVELEDVNNPDTLKTLIYSFKPGTPNFVENLSIPEYSFTRKFEINLITSSGTAIPWLSVAPENIPMGGDAIFRAYLLGTQSNGIQFVTFGPQVPEYVLRDPPGSSSSAKREIGTTKTESTEWNWSLGTSVNAKDKVFAGTKIEVGLGVSTEIEVQADIAAGFSAEISGGRNGSQSVTTTNTRAWSTYDGTVIAPGANSDLYIGKSRNVQFGIAEELTIIPNDLRGRIEPLGDEGLAGGNGSFSFGKKYGLSVIPGGFATNFIFNEYDIKTLVIPNLVNLRNVMLQSNPKYTSFLPIGDENYGKNNDDPVFGDNVTTTTPNAGEMADLKGPSYQYRFDDLEDALTGDSVRVLNHQISKWEEAIRLNEWEKVNIGNQTVIDSLRTKALNDLEAEYAQTLEAYYALIAVGGVGGVGLSFALIANPIPGTSFAGYAAFAVTTGTGIALAELFEEYQTYLNKRSRIQEKFDQLGAPINYTVTGGTTFEESITHESAVSNTRSMEYGLSAALYGEFAAKISNNGLGLERSVEMKFSSGRNWGQESSQTETVSYTLNESDIGDLLSIDVYPSMLGWGPIFKTKAGSGTSCPHEEAVVTSYYNPGTEISPATLQLERPTISASPSILTNIPPDQAAVFNLTLGNESDFGYTQGYTLRVISASNPFGAIVRFDGQPSQVVEIPGGSSINKVMTVSKGPGTVYNYDSLLVVFTSQCQYTAGTGFNTDIADSVYVSVRFLPTCADVSLAYPEDNWVLNNSFNDTMPVAIVDYDINLQDLNFLRVDYKPSDRPNWIGLQTFYKDTTGLTSATPIPTTTPFTLYDWDVAQLPDGRYDLRITSNCDFAEKTSATRSGIIDRINPHPFGNPSPADGILSPNDEISIKFNEPIYGGSINPTFNFDIRGVTNGTGIQHGASLLFDGVDDYMEVTGGVPLQRRDFTIEFSAKRGRRGEEAIISQGAHPNERLFIGFDAANHFVFRINDQEVASTAVFEDYDWHYFAVSYDFEGEKAELFVADGNNTAYISNNGNTTIYPDYTGAGKLIVGRNSVNNGNPFAGNLRELRIWNTTRTLSEFSLTKNTLMGGSELGLAYNWRLDEAGGNIAEEQVRRRDAVIVGPSWQISPSGNSIQLDGFTTHIKAFTGDVNITQGMDFTLEFWFKSSQAGPATLFSNGTGTSFGADSLLSWNIDKDASGLIHVRHKGIDFVATNTNYFDGSWHHFALVLQRSGNLSAYVDGNLQNATQALPFKQLGGSHMYLGARGYTSNQFETIENRFNGQMDEFRVWNTARKAFQIKRDRHHRMSGNELGLKLYFPFEYYSADPTGIPILTPTFNEQINSALHTVEPYGPIFLSHITPTIKLQRPVQAIAFTYSLNNDQIILTPTTSQEIIENVTLDITVEGLKDLHGNVMESPVTWIAYIDKNQVIWQDDLLGFSMMQGDDLSFQTSILNQGGSVKAFQILNIPDWLSVTPRSGVVNPNSALSVHFRVDPEISIGDYINDISLLTDFNFPERLTIDLRVRKEEPDWSVNPGNFEQSMSIIGRLSINDVISTDEEDMLVAMVGEEVRGVAHLEYVAPIDAYLIFMDVYSDGNANEAIEFRIWDASSGTVFADVLPINIAFNSNSILGSVFAPQLFSTDDKISLDVNLSAGWNWLGFPLLYDTPTDINRILASFEHNSGDILLGQFEFAKFETAMNLNSWIGPLTSVGIQPEQLYKLKTSTAGVLTMKGRVIDPATRPIHLANGWTWIGFISIRNLPIAQALGNLNPNAGDIIKGKTQFAIYEPSVGWIGSLRTLRPGQGFMYFSNGTTNTFTYPLAGMFSNLVAPTVPGRTAADSWVVRADKFNTNMTMICSVETECGEALTAGKYAIGLTDAAGALRGVAPIEQLLDQELSYITVAGENGDHLSLRLLGPDGQLNIELGQSLNYSINQHIGGVQQPFSVKISDEVCLQLLQNETEPQNSLKVFPTLFKEYFVIDYYAEQMDEQAWLSVANAWGQVIFNTKMPVRKGYNQQRIDLSGNGWAPGLYTVKLHTNGEVISKKLIKAN